jgi:hypothetical protein
LWKGGVEAFVVWESNLGYFLATQNVTSFPFSLLLADIFYYLTSYKTKRMTTKAIFAGLIAAVAAFLLGFLIWGFLLKDTMESYSNMACMRAEEDLNLILISASQIVWGLLYAWILSKMGSITSFASGAGAGAILGGAFALGIDLMLHATTTLMTSATGIFIDIVANMVVGAVMGGIIGLVLGRK